MVKTAVLMATYNGEKFLKNQLDSIKNQELRPDVVIFRDDGSSDQTVKFLENYISENNLENWFINVNEKNLGWRLNFRQLLIDSQVFDVDYVFFSDQDDTWNLDKNRRQIEVMEEHPYIDLLSGDIAIKKISEQATVPTYFQFSDQTKEISKYPARYNYQSYRSGWTLALKNEYVSELLKYWKPEYAVTHDVIVSVLASLLGTGYNLNQVVGIHIRHAGNASGKMPVNLHSTRQVNIEELYKAVGFYDIMYHVLKDKNSSYTKMIKEYYDFSLKRYNLARENKKIPVFIQIIRNWKYYGTMSSRIRDIIFLFKK